MKRFETGDILYGSWGYDQTNADFFQIVKATEKTVTIRQLNGKIERWLESGLAGYKVPIKDSFSYPFFAKEGDQALKRRITVFSRPDASWFYGVKVNDFLHLVPWDGEEKFFSEYA